MPPSETSEHYLVSGHVVTPATNEIALEGRVTRIEPRSMDVLVILLSHAGEVMTREALQDAVWGDVVVGDDSLTNAIIKLRKAFGDDARNPRLIETIPKRGYRLIAEVSTLPDPSPPDPPPPDPPPPDPAPPDPPARTPAASAPAAPAPVGSGRRIGVGLVAVLAALGVALAIWAFADRTGPAASHAAVSDPHIGVAVAPFRNLSGDPAQDYLAQGVEQTILAGLAGIPRIAAMHAGATAASDYRLEGSVQRAGERIRIDTQLLETASGVVVSAQRYERAFSDLLTIQSEIEGDILTALAVEIDHANRTAQSRGLTESVEAYELFLKARAALLPRDRTGNTRAQRLYARAIALDPNFARAYGGLALSYAAEYRNGWTDNGPAALERAKTMADTALGIQPNLPAQHWVVAYVETQRRNLSSAVAALETALRLDPGYADAYALLGGVRTYAGTPQETIPLLREAMRLRPDAGYLYFLLLGRAYYFLDDCDQARINLGAAVERNPANLETHVFLAACMVRQGDGDEASWEAEEILGIDPDFNIASFFSTYPMVAQNQVATLSADLKAAGLG